MHNYKASSFGGPSTQPADWAVKEFAQAGLSDQRHVKRLEMIATAFAQKPTATIPQACSTWAEGKGAYRFFENDQIAPSAIRQSHHQATLQRVRTHPIVLALQDTSALNYSTHPQTHRPVSALDVGRHADGPTAWLSAQRGTRTPRLRPGCQSPSPQAGSERKLQMGGEFERLPSAGAVVSTNNAGQHRRPRG